MKKQGHPDYQDILFEDSSTGTQFVCGSTLKPTETKKFEGKDYPVYRVPISSASHPFFTGSKQFLDTEGRVDKFRKRYEKKPEIKVESPKEKKVEKKPAPKKQAKTTKKK